MITQISFPHELAKTRGLCGGTLERLGKVVILAGPNGSGKSRYLDLVHTICGIYVADMMPTTLIDPERSTHEQISSEPDNPWAEALRKITISPMRNGYRPVPVWLSYPSESAEIDDARQMSPFALREAAKATRSVGFKTAFNGMHAYCTQIARAMYHAEHHLVTKRDTIIQQQQDAKMFNNILRALLGGEIGFTIEDTEILPTFRNRPLVGKELSPGERILFTWAISLHQQGPSLANAIILIDEPESHLHHEACIRALTKLRDDVLGPEGQIWLATHSVPLLAWGGLDSVHFVKDGAIEFAGNKVTSVVESLLGGKEGRDRLKTFLSDADEIAFMEFAVQCVLPAGVADPKTGDKQQAQFIEMLHQRLSSQQQIRILDFSAGKGRFGSALRERLSAHEEAPLRQRIEYHAYNVPQFTDDEVKAACKSRIVDLGQPGTVDDYYWESLSKLQARHGQALRACCKIKAEADVGRQSGSRPAASGRGEWNPVFHIG
jgi:predicted ATPase